MALRRDLLNDRVPVRINGDGDALPYIEIGSARLHAGRIPADELEEPGYRCFASGGRIAFQSTVNPRSVR